MKCNDSILCLKEILALTSASRVTLWRWEHKGLFPARRQIGPRRVGWLQSEVDEWLASRPKANGDEGKAADHE